MISQTIDTDVLNCMPFVPAYNEKVRTFNAETLPAAISLIADLRKAFPSPYVVMVKKPSAPGEQFVVTVR